MDAADFPKPYFRPSRSSPANCRHLRRVRLHAAAPGCKIFDHQHLPHPCHQSPSLVPKIISEKYQQSACAKNLPLVHVSPAPSPLRLVTFEFPGTTTVLFCLNLSFHIKQSLMPTKKREAPSISKNTHLKHTSIPPAYYLSFG